VLGLLALSLVAAAPAYADIGRPHPVTAVGHRVEALDQATDARGRTFYLYSDGSDLMLRVRRPDGGLRAPVLLDAHDGPRYAGYNVVAVNDRGDGFALWDTETADSTSSRLQARSFTRNGRLGPVVTVSQPITEFDHVSSAELAVRPDGTAVAAWSLSLLDSRGTVPYARVLRPGGHRGHVLDVGSGPDAQGPFPVPASRGRVLLGWGNDGLRARYLGRSGRLHHPMRRVGPRYGLEVDAAGIARDGTVIVGCTGGRIGNRACVARLTPRLRLIGRIHPMSPNDENINPGVQLGVAPGGQAVVTWLVLGNDNPRIGGWARAIDTHGRRGPIRRLNTAGQNGPVTLEGKGDGVITSARCGPDESSICHRIQITRVRHGRIGATHSRRTGGLQYFYWRSVIEPSGRVVTTYVHDDRMYAVTGW
jgi:hypothetical protein